MSRHGRVGGITFPVAVVVLQVGTWFAMVASSTDWLGSWRQAIDNAAGTVVLTGPLLAGLVAGTYASLRQTGLPDVVVSSARPVRGWFGPALRLWSAAIVSLGMLLAAVTARAGLLGVPISVRPFLIVPVAIAVLGVHALVGLGIGQCVAPRFAAMLAALLSFGLFLLAVDHLAPPSFVTGGVTGPMFGEQYRSSSVAVLLAYAILSALALAPWVGWRRRSRWRTQAAITALAVAVIFGLAQVSWPDLESRLEPAAVSYRCGGSAPEVCVVADRRAGDLEEISRRLRELGKPLLAIGASLPERWKQQIYGRPPDQSAGVLVMTGDAELGGRLSDSDLIQSLIRPAVCTQYPVGGEPASAFGSRVRILNWLVARDGLGDASNAAPWYSSRRSEVWVRTTYAQLRRCDLDAIQRP